MSDGLFLKLFKACGMDSDILMTKGFIVRTIGDNGFHSLLLTGHIYESESVTKEGEKLYAFG